jgi:hypothetical protein
VRPDVLISPLPTDVTDVAQLLLGLAEDATHVQTTTDGEHGIGFEVPEYLHKLFLKALKFKAGEDATDEATPVKRGPGRPKKNTDTGS